MGIAAASIIAKVERDKIMRAYDRVYAQYGFCRNKGYEYLRTYESIKNLFVPIHRKAFL